jgi:hypothetical protein
LEIRSLIDRVGLMTPAGQLRYAAIASRLRPAIRSSVVLSLKPTAR